MCFFAGVLIPAKPSGCSFFFPLGPSLQRVQSTRKTQDKTASCLVPLYRFFLGVPRQKDLVVVSVFWFPMVWVAGF